MTNLEKYIQKVKNETNGMTELEKVRYVYLDLGSKLSFDINYATGNRERRQRIYRNSVLAEVQDECLEKEEGICKSMALIIQKVLQELGIKIRTVAVAGDFRRCPHVYNIIEQKDGVEYRIDLQEDIKNIKSKSFTKNFGVELHKRERVIPRKTLEEIDKKIGYISKENYYSDEYLYLLKSDMDLFEDFLEKADFIITNLEPQNFKKIEYLERKWHHQEILCELFSDKELNKVHFIDCYEIKNDEKIYYNCIAISYGEKTNVYMYDEKEGMYKKISAFELKERFDNGLNTLEKIPNVKKLMKEAEER